MSSCQVVLGGESEISKPMFLHHVCHAHPSGAVSGCEQVRKERGETGLRGPNGEDGGAYRNLLRVVRSGGRDIET